MAHTGQNKTHTLFWWRKLRHLENPGVDGRKILKFFLKNWKETV
jgi:hypothetical protein